MPLSGPAHAVKAPASPISLVLSATQRAMEGTLSKAPAISSRPSKSVPTASKSFKRARVAFVEREYKNDHMLHLRAPTHMVRVLNVENSSDRAEGDKICFKMVSIIDEMKSHPSMHRDWENGGFMKLESVVVYVIGLFNMNVGSKESQLMALDSFERAIDLFTLESKSTR